MKLINNEFEGRLDIYLSKNLKDVSRNFIQKNIEQGKVKVNNKVITTKSFKIKISDIIEIEEFKLQEYNIKPEPINIEIIYQDSNYAIVNKPANMITHPVANIVSGTLVNALLYHLKDLSGIGGVLRPGIVHRLDKDTSGLLIVAKNDKAHRLFVELLKDREIQREYIAVVEGIISEDEGEINAPIRSDPKNRLRMAVISGGKEAVTFFKVIKRFKNASLLTIRLKTGRTHQIRTHLSYIKHPVAGDPLYGAIYSLINRPALHSHKLKFTDPFTKLPKKFKASIPNDIKNLILRLHNEKN
ncbi:MAG: RluA family pseudouridine synthase [Candidatus Hydrogenedentota bacterium]